MIPNFAEIADMESKVSGFRVHVCVCLCGYVCVCVGGCVMYISISL